MSLETFSYNFKHDTLNFSLPLRPQKQRGGLPLAKSLEEEARGKSGPRRALHYLTDRSPRGLARAEENNRRKARVRR